MRRSFFVFAILVLAAPAAVRAQSWQLLGVKNINYALTTDALDASRASGKYQTLKLKVKRSPLKVNSVTVHFTDGQKQTYNLNADLAMGKESNVLTLPSGGRTLRSVELVYDNTSKAGSKAAVELWGKK